MNDAMHEHSPPVLSVPLFEGGFTFLRRALGVAIADPTQSVIVNTRRLNVTYVHNDENVTFSDGVTCVEFRDGITAESLQQARQTMAGFDRVADVYSIRQGLAELALIADR